MFVCGASVSSESTSRFSSPIVCDKAASAGERGKKNRPSMVGV
jgi:hypothetical protein